MSEEQEIGYRAARAAAPAVEAFFRRHADGARLVPSAAVVERLLDAAFWASLRHEEGRTPRISLAYLPPESAGELLRFQQPLPLDPAALTRLAPAVEHPGIHLGVWDAGGADGLAVWGAARTIPKSCFVLEVVQAGLLAVKRRRGQAFAKFGNVAVLEGDRVRLVDEEGASIPDCPGLVGSLLGFDAPASWGESLNLLVQLAAAMRAHGRGGSLLVVPSGSAAWRESIVWPVRYAVHPPFDALGRLLRKVLGPTATGQAVPAEEADAAPAGRASSPREGIDARDALLRAVDTVAGLTAVDGATVISDAYDVHAFGAKIQRRWLSQAVERMTVTEPVLGNVPVVVSPVEVGGTRHLSAAQFVHDQRDALAMVASQDGRFTVFAWSPCEEMVHAHRVEVLLL